MRATEKKPWKDGAIERTEAVKRQQQKENKRAKEREEQIQTKRGGGRDAGREAGMWAQTPKGLSGL